ncbi:MAG TPA: pyruvate kinase, partial [Polyangiaceae bacterium]
MSGSELPLDLLEAMRRLKNDVNAAGEALFGVWRPSISRPGFDESAHNLACYLALRRHDLPALQLALTRWGLSSLGRSESRVRETLDAVIAALSAVCRLEPTTLPPYPSEQAMFNGAQLLSRETDLLFGAARSQRRTRIMVTLPSEAADDRSWMRALVQSGVDCVRINCAHDGMETWGAMLQNLKHAEREHGGHEPVRVLMDLGGPKVRTVRPRKNERDLYHIGDKLLLTAASEVERLAKHKHKHGSRPLPVVGCTLLEALDCLAAGESVHIDDGKISARAVERVPDGVLIELTRAPTKGRRIRSNKGLNFPDTDFQMASLTEKDRMDLKFVARHADMIGYSFVQTSADIAALHTALAECMPRDRAWPALILKIETKRAVTNLPELIVHAAGKLPTGVMIARGDLAIELGFERIAEMQEEILWLCEAASVPVVWATQVLDELAKEGIPTRAEVTDAAMANRAECVMLNKGPHIMDAI